MSEINLDRVVEILKQEHGIPNAVVEQTGGGCATIFAGPTRADECSCDRTGTLQPHDRSCPVPHGDVKYAAVAGPGSYGWGERPSMGDFAEFAVGADDDGDSTPVDAQLAGARDERDVARLIAAQARKLDPRTSLSSAEVGALGMDGSGRGLDVAGIHRRALAEHAEKVCDALAGLLGYWIEHDLPGDFAEDRGFPFSRSLEDQLAEVHGWAERLGSE